MLPVKVLPDAELVAVNYVRAALAARSDDVVSGAQVGVVVVAPVPPVFVRLRRAGGLSTTPGVDTARLDVQVWHTTDFKRMALAQIVRALLTSASGDAVSSNQIYFVGEFMGPTQMPDPADPTKRIVMFTVEMAIR